MSNKNDTMVSPHEPRSDEDSLIAELLRQNEGLVTDNTNLQRKVDDLISNVSSLKSKIDILINCNQSNQSIPNTSLRVNRTSNIAPTTQLHSHPDNCNQIPCNNETKPTQQMKLLLISLTSSTLQHQEIATKTTMPHGFRSPGRDLKTYQKTSETSSLDQLIL